MSQLTWFQTTDQRRNRGVKVTFLVPSPPPSDELFHITGSLRWNLGYGTSCSDFLSFV